MPVRIERKFYDLEKAQWDEITEEVRREEENCTEAEREANKRKAQEELQKIFRIGEAYANTWKRVSNRRRIELFQKLAEQALWMAEHLSCNIAVEAKENSLGKIALEFECFVLTSFGERETRAIFSDLFLAADDIYMDVSSNGLCRMEFCFELYQDIPAGQVM